MNYTYPPEEYVKLLNAYKELEKLAFSPEDSRETVLRKLAERNAERGRIADRANTMIREYMKIPVIVLTVDHDAELKALKMGAMDFIPKPYPDIEIVKARIAKCITLSEWR